MIERYRIKYGKENIVRFVSHLEVVTFLRRAVRRSGLALNYSQGFNPQIRLALGPALPLGYESNTEFFDLELARAENPKKVKELLGAQMPAGFSIIEVRQIPLSLPSLEQGINLAEYEIFAELDEEKIKTFLQLDKFVIIKSKKGKEEEIDLRPLILKLNRENGRLKLLLLFGPKKNVRPELILQKVFQLSEEAAKLTRVRRINLYGWEPGKKY